MWNHDNCFFTCPDDFVFRYPGPFVLMNKSAAMVVNSAATRKCMRSSSDESDDDPDKLKQANDTSNIDPYIAAAAPRELSIFENHKLKNKKR